MKIKPAQPPSLSYNTVAKFLHWLIALAIIAMLIIGFVMTAKDAANKFVLFQLHKSLGITILLLSLFRLVWRWMNPPPPLPLDMPRWEKLAARLTHALFYVLMIGMPLVGWALVSASPMNVPTILYGFIHWPSLPMPADDETKKNLRHLAGGMHYYGSWLLVAMLGLHIVAAWKHHLFNRDNVLINMAPDFLHRLLNRARGF